MEKVKHKMNKPLEPGLKMPKNYEIKAIKLTSLALTTFLITLFAASILAPTQTSSAESSQILLATQVNDSSVSLTTSGNVSLALQASVAGTVQTAQDTVTVSASNTGYQLYLSMSGAENSLIRDNATPAGTDANTGLPTYADSDLIPAGGGDTISSPTTLGNNTWGFAVAQTNTTSGSGSEDVVATGFDESYPVGENSVASSKFTKVPAKGSEVLIAKRASSADSVTTNFYYGAKVTSAKPSGLYKNTITYTVISDGSASGLASVTPDRITLTGGEIVISTPSTATLESLGTITATVGGEECTNPTASKNEAYVNVTCTAPALAEGIHEVIVNFENAGETYVVAGGLEYYSDGGSDSTPQELAIAAINSDDTEGILDLAGILTMQEMTAEVCNAMKFSTATSNASKAYKLIDSRDHNTYNVAKLNDGLCWMVSNLRLGETNTAITLTSATSDVSSDTTIPASAIVSSGSTSWQSPVDAWHAYVQPNATYGNLYNWYTATAGTGTSSMQSESATNTTDAPASICPKGWKLPKGGDNGTGSFQGLITAASIGSSGSKLNGTPYSFHYAGLYRNGGLYYQGSDGYYWSRSAYTLAESAYNLSFSPSNVYPQRNLSKYHGFSVRCIFSGSSFQDFTVTMCNNLETGKTITLYDNRDGNVYAVAKLGDNNCWTTQNLRLGATPGALTTAKAFTLTSADSDVASDFSVATSDIQSSGTTSWGNNEKHVYVTGNSAYGNYYNWHTATAGTGLSSTTSGDAPSSICPVSGMSGISWKIPPNSGNGSYYNLFRTKLGWVSSASGTDATHFGGSSSTIVQAPYSFPLSGGYRGGVDGQEFYGLFWSRTAYDANKAYNFDFSSDGSFYLQYNYYKDYGFSVRCVLVTSE